MRTCLFLVVAIGVTPMAATAADDRWVEVRSPHFTVVSNASEGRARSVAWQFEQIRSAIQAGWPWARVQLDRPVLVVAAKDETTMKLLLPRYWESGDRANRPVSVFMTAPDRHYIAMRDDVKADDTEGINPYFASYWAYSAVALNAAFERELPLWFRSGLTEVLSNSIVRDNEIQFGRAIPWHIAGLQQEGRLRLSELITLDAQSPYYTNGSTRGRFDAQSWGVIHYLLFGRTDDRADRVNQLAKLLLSGRSSAQAIQEVFGSVEALETAYLQYQRKPITQYARLKVEASSASKDFPIRALSAPESLVVRAALHGVTGRTADARSLIAEARKSAAEAPAAYVVDAMLLDREGKPNEARLAFGKAADLKSENFYSYYRLAVLAWRTNPDDATRSALEQSLRRSVALNDSFAPSQALLAETIALGPQAAEALSFANRAVALEPGDAGIRLSLARVLWQLSRRDEAKATARAARTLARTEEDRKEAEELLAFFDRAPVN